MRVNFGAFPETKKTMPEPSMEAYEPYAERVMRSVAHNIGNVVNVISGRLSLLELQEGMGPESLEMIALMRDRLRRTQGELREAVRFVSETTYGNAPQQGVDIEVARSLENALVDAPGRFEGLDVLKGEQATTFRVTQPLTPSLTLLTLGLRRIFAQTEGLVWRFEVNSDGLVLDLLAPVIVLPADRRSLMEPWFDAGAIACSLEVRRGRLELATALGRLEDGGGQVSAGKDGADISRLRIVWPKA